MLRSVNSRAFGMTMTFPALNGLVLLTATDQIVSEMVVGIIPLMVFNGFLPALFAAFRGRQGDWAAMASIFAVWAALASLLEWRVLWPYRAQSAAIAAVLGLACAAWAFLRLRAAGARSPRSPAIPGGAAFLRARAPRILCFFVSLAIVSAVAHAFRDAHSLVGRLSALPLVPLFVLHLAVRERRAEIDEIRVSALLGPVAAGAFLAVFMLSLAFVRTGAGDLHPGYWPIGTAMLLACWELTRRLILGLSTLSYRE